MFTTRSDWVILIKSSCVRCLQARSLLAVGSPRWHKLYLFSVLNQPIQPLSSFIVLLTITMPIFLLETVSTILFRIDILNKIMNAVWECLGWHIFVLIRVETVTWLQDVRPACWECGGCGHPQHLTHFVLQKYLQWNYATKYIRHASKYNRSFWVSWLVGDFLYINATKYITNIFSIYSTQ